MSQPHAEAMDTYRAVVYTPYDKSSNGKTGNIIMLAHFEEVNLLSETLDDAKKTATNPIDDPIH